MSNNQSYSNRKEKYDPIWPVDELTQFFKQKSLPKMIRLNACSFIGDVERFVESHLEIVRHNNGNKLFENYYLRLLQLKDIL
jgi:hypothetical protein